MFMEGIISYQEFIEGDLELINRSDVVLMRGEWESSTGANKERRHALITKKPVFEHMSELFEWVEKQEKKQ